MSLCVAMDLEHTDIHLYITLCFPVAGDPVFQRDKQAFFLDFSSFFWGGGGGGRLSVCRRRRRRRLLLSQKARERKKKGEKSCQWLQLLSLKKIYCAAMLLV